jgi:hypothetical protein
VLLEPRDEVQRVDEALILLAPLLRGGAKLAKADAQTLAALATFVG